MSFTCLSCHVLFSTPDLQREHHKSDWHRYNLKRRVAQLPPVSAETFKERALSQRAKLEADSDRSNFCPQCHKHFNSKNAYENHLKSKKHKDGRKPEVPDVAKRNARNKSSSFNFTSKINKEHRSRQEVTSEVQPDSGSVDGNGSDWESCSDDEVLERDAIAIEECLFCDHKSSDMELSIEHMTVAHSFFIPDIDYLTDLQGLITYLGWKTGVGKVCLWCSNINGHAFQNSKSVKQHMVDKGHCKMKFEGHALLEVSDFYDYSSSYPEDSKDDVDDEIDVSQLDGDDWQLVLPSGSTIGHRSLRLFFKQNVPSNRTPVRKTIHRVMNQYKSLGWTGTSGVAALLKAKDIRFVQRVQHKQMLRMGIKNNSIKQKHFRNQIMF